MDISVLPIVETVDVSTQTNGRYLFVCVFPFFFLNLFYFFSAVDYHFTIADLRSALEIAEARALIEESLAVVGDPTADEFETLLGAFVQEDAVIEGVDTDAAMVVSAEGEEEADERADADSQ